MEAQVRRSSGLGEVRWPASGLTEMYPKFGGQGLRPLADSTEPTCACEEELSEVGGWGAGEGKCTALRFQYRDPPPLLAPLFKRRNWGGGLVR